MQLHELEALVSVLRETGADHRLVEAKRAEGGLPSTLRASLSAFSNTAGGTIILGLDESTQFTATGVADPAKMASDLASMCSSEMHPPVRPVISQLRFEDVWLVIAEVPELEVGLKPCYYVAQGLSRGSYLRVHDGDQHLSSYEVQMLMANRGQPTDDAYLVPGTSVDADLDSALVQRFIERVRTVRPYAFAAMSRDEILLMTKVAGRDDRDEIAPTLAGLLALGRYPQQHYPQLSVTLVVYPSENGPDVVSGTRFLDNITLEGPIPAIARDALAAVRRNMRRRSTVSGVGRQETWEYPEAALREAIVNAMVHRDLSAASRGSQVQIELYPNRIVIRNPGGLYGPVSLSQITEVGTSSARNSFLLKMLEDVALPGDDKTVCENRGSGMKTIVESLRAAGMSLPKLEDRISSFSVTFPNHALLNDDVVDWIARLGESGLTDSQCIGLAVLRSGDTLDNSSYRSATGVDSRVATFELQDLVSRELVMQTGSGRWTAYKLSNRTRVIASEQNRRLPPRDRRQLILEVLSHRSLSRAEIEVETGLGKQVVTHWLRVLRQERLVLIEGDESPQSKNVRYVRSPESLGQNTLDFSFGDI